MNARLPLPLRRGACPGLSAPMSTGDGLLVRLVPTDEMALDAFIALCAAARMHGNGTMEVTARGSLQVRGIDAGLGAAVCIRGRPPRHRGGRRCDSADGTAA